MSARVGYIAKRILDRGPTGIVLAAFDRSAYLEVDGSLVCLADSGLDDGPLTVPCGDVAALRSDMRYTPDIRGLTVWRPAAPKGWTLASLRNGYGAALHCAARRAPRDGAARCVFGSRPSNAETIAAQPAIGTLRDWLQRSFVGTPGRVPDDVCGLLGLGQGLTPSGDDVLCGVMVAAHALGRADIANALYAGLPLSKTNRISAAHLAAAREGAATAPLHRVLNAVLRGGAETLSSQLAGLDRVGHSSGWDGFAGCIVALDAYRRASVRHPIHFQEDRAESRGSWIAKGDSK